MPQTIGPFIAAPGKSFWLGSIDIHINTDEGNMLRAYGKKEAIKMFHKLHKGHENADMFYLHRVLLKPGSSIFPEFLYLHEETHPSGISQSDINDTYDAYFIEHQKHHIIGERGVTLYANKDKLDISTEHVATNWNVFNYSI